MELHLQGSKSVGLCRSFSLRFLRLVVRFLGWPIHAQTLLIGGFASDLYLGNTMFDMYMKCGLLDYGRNLFDEMTEGCAFGHLQTPLVLEAFLLAAAVGAANRRQGPPVSFPVAYDVGISYVSRAPWVHAELYHSLLVYACDASEMEGHDRTPVGLQRRVAYRA